MSVQQQQPEQQQRSNGKQGNGKALDPDGRFASSAAPPSSSSASPAQRRANRQNAKKSTGPKTAEGKARSAYNARTHGAFCRDVLLPGEDPADLCELIVGVYNGLSPQNALERELADRVVWGHWRLRRLRRGERYAYGTGADRRADRDEGDFLRQTWDAGRGSRHRTAIRRVLGLDPNQPTHPDDIADPKAAAEAHRKFEQRDAAFRHGPAEQMSGLHVAQAIADPAGAVERFSRIAQRLEQSVSRAMRELRELRRDREEVDVCAPCPYLEGLDDEDEEEDEQNASAPSVPSEDVVTEVTTPLGGAQNEPNSSDAVAGDGAGASYEQRLCNIDFASLLKRAAFGAATSVNERRRGAMSA